MTNQNEQQTIEEIVRLAHKNGLMVNRESAQVNETGMDFQVVFADDDTGVPWVLRKPRRHDVVERAAAEGNALAFLRKHLSAAVPDWRIHTPELIAYPRLDGIPAAGIDLEEKQYVWNMDHQPPSDDFVRSLAGILAELHGTDPAAAAEAGIEVLNPNNTRQSIAKSMDNIKRELGVSDHLWRRWQKWMSDDSYWPGFSALIHGDLHPAHMLIGKNQRVTGLLDWTEAKVADPAKDFVAYQMILGDKETARLLRHYGEEGGGIWKGMQEHITEMQAAYPIDIAKFALQTKQDDHMEMARGALGLDQ
ncbi:macrolide 2'-phosphotransferase [Bacillus atrophaeus]|uniref:macrolide 2'-phosphotransferase n=1 Tax=Bacillus atrophaeus TaxID=1452 RepID=UPI00227E4B88|nr:macrolide 2'-phosphotransferase [Bacillus atrophaeus]MCY8515540.1 macrolide 2'-phosphotransferase [Bacillus atrophaeus]MCY8992777.1 macrolide 2'-phosphotransferase [Bacillus atrophaeus]